MKIKTCAILYNTSFDLLDLNLQNNYKFVKHFLGEQELLSFFDETPMGLRRKYQEACLNPELDIITAESNYYVSDDEYLQPSLEYELLTHLDRQIRLIRLVCNCTLHFSEFRYEFVTSKNQVIVGTIPHIDQRIEKNNIPFSIGKDQIKSIEKCFSSPYPFKNEWVYRVFDFYDSAFLLNDEKSLVILITAFEMVFLKKEKGSKTKMISKRSAVYFGRSNDEISYIYDQMKQAYSDRSNYIHEGKEINNLAKKVEYLRHLLSQFILATQNTNICKDDFINEQIEKVKKSDISII